jgi:radical SAM protein with 4Fe4S-binding SPASM domain
MDRKSIPRRLSLIRSWRDDGPTPGFSVTLEVAFRCNVRCVFCSRWSDPTDLRLEAIEGIAEDMAALGAGYVSLTGGDPFVRRDIREIIDVFAERSIPVHINTNGVVLTKFADFLLSRAAAIRGITVSIDSPHPEVHDEIRGVDGTFRRALAGMERIRHAIPVSLACTLNQKNMHEIEQYTQFAAEHGFPFRFQPLHDDGDNQLAPNQDGVEVADDELTGLTERLESIPDPGRPFELRQYYRLFEPFFRDRQAMDSLRCVAAARLIYFVSPQGDVYPCDTRRDVRLGNVYETRLAEIIRGGSSTDWRQTCREGRNGCWCMYACVAPNNLRFQDLPLLSVTRGGWPLKKRWERRVAAYSGHRTTGETLAVRQPVTDLRDWPFVGIVVASYNGGDFLQRTLERLLDLDYPQSSRELILVDDAGEDGSIEAAEKRFADSMASGALRIVRNPQSLGVAGAYNRGVLEASPNAEYLLKADNDVLVEKGALRALVALAETNPRAGILGGRIYYHADPERIQFLGGNLDSPWRGPALIRTPDDLTADPAGSDPRYLDVINSCLSLVRREVFERAGLYPESYGRYEYEDYDLAFRARKLGYGSLYCPAAVGHHAVSLTSTANDLGRVRLHLRARNGTVLMSRFTPRSWFARFLLYHLAKLPVDFVRHGHSPWTLLKGYAEGVRVALRADFPDRYLPTRRDPAPPFAESGKPQEGLQVLS